MIRLLLVMLLAATVGTAVATPSARLSALADDGILIEDIGGDGMWPALIGHHGPLKALTMANRDDEAFLALEARRDFGAGVMGRVHFETMNQIRSGQPRIQLQGAKGFGPLTLGLGWGYDGPLEDRDTALSSRTGQLGARWIIAARTVVDGTVERGAWRPGSREVTDAAVSRWRVRGHHQVNDHVVFVVAVARDDSEAAPASDMVYNSPRTLFNNAEHLETGLILWPDKDSQITLSWLERTVHDVVLTHAGDFGWSHHDRWTEHGLHLSVEVRPSAWFTLRMGFEYLRPTNDAVVADGSTVRFDGSTSLGLGSTVHLGETDLGLSWSSGRAADGRQGSGHGLDLQAFVMDIVTHF